MVDVKRSQTARLMVAFNVVPQLSLREDWSRKLFERLQDEFPQLLGTSLVEPDQVAAFYRPLGEGEAMTASTPPICQLIRQAVQIVLERPSDADAEVLPAFARRVYELTRDIFHVSRVSRLGRVEQTGYFLDTQDDAAVFAILNGLTKLTAEEAADIQLQLLKREGPFNMNLALSAASSSPEPAASGLPVRDILVAQSDVNNFDVTRDIHWATAEQILSRGARHAHEDVPAFLRERLGVHLD